MANKKRVYQAETLGLPPLKMVLGSIPDPEGNWRKHTFRPFGASQDTDEAKDTLNKLIGHLKKDEE